MKTGRKIIDRKGEIGYNNQGLKMKIIDYRKYSDIDIQFEDGYISKNKKYGEFKDGKIRNPYYKSIYGIGFIGEGIYSHKNNYKEYNCWHDMLRRCYSSELKIKKPTYENCTVCKEWHCFQNFAKWFNENYYEIDGEKMCLDKDILFKGNKIYSPKTCVFVPNDINLLFIKSDKSRGNYSIGVTYHKRDKVYEAKCNTGKGNNRIHLGRYDTEVEAFNAYKKFKEDFIKEMANEYKEKIPEKLYNSMIKWEVDIND